MERQIIETETMTVVVDQGVVIEVQAKRPVDSLVQFFWDDPEEVEKKAQEMGIDTKYLANEVRYYLYAFNVQPEVI